MQLAASVQRAHPPPVPPRPSRQVVAEALKKSPRPPCPTRQAPPPPNQRPWRSSEEQQSKDGGRTIVYDSAHLRSNGKVVGPMVNGMVKTRIEDTSRRKDEETRKRNNNNADENDNHEEEKGAKETKTEVMGMVSKKNVTFVETQAEENNDNKENCATVVVIDEVEATRSTNKVTEEPDNIQRLDWLEAGVRYSATKITLPAEESNVAPAAAVSRQEKEMLDEGTNEEEEGRRNQEFADLDFSSIIERIAMSSLQGLPPLPRSLSGFNLNGAGLEPPPPPPARSTSKASTRSVKTPSSTTSLSSQGSRPSPQGRQLTTLDTQLAILRREMFGLRQLDLSLLSQLWSLNESIQEFRQLLQDQEDRVPSPSPSSEEGDDTSYSGPHQPPPPPRRPPSHHRHHHRAAAARSSKLPISDESPSSEEYGAV